SPGSLTFLLIMEAQETVTSRLSRIASQRPQGIAFRESCATQGTGKTWAEVATDIECLAAGLIGQGVQLQDRVLIWGANSARWILADLAIMACGAITVPIYAATTASQAEFILRETEATFAFLDSAQYSAAAATWQLDASTLKGIVLLQGSPPSKAL